MTDISEQKKLLRQIIRKRRKSLTQEEIYIASNTLCNNLATVCSGKKRIAIYHANYKEISLETLITYLIANKHEVFRPIAYKNSREMEFEQIYSDINSDIFVNENYVPENTIKCYNLDLILLPLLAIDKQGFRLGQGGGYYDTTLSNRNPTTILCGVGYDWQLIDNVPHDSFDIAMDIFVSDKQIKYFK